MADIPDTQGTHIYNLFKEGWAFLIAIFGWVWHAGRLATKVAQLEHDLNEHLKEYSKLQRDITSIKEAVAFMRGSNHYQHSYKEEDDE